MNYSILLCLCALIYVKSQNDCQIPFVYNAKVQYSYSDNGIIASIECHKPFRLIGDSPIYCTDGSWNSSFYLCAQNNCTREIFSNGIINLLDEETATLSCNENFALIGPSFVYCDGNDWNITDTECLANKYELFKTCTFEQDENHCQWEIFHGHSFQWTVATKKDVIDKELMINFPAPCDYTSMFPKCDDKFLLLIPKKEVKNDSYGNASIISPLFPSINEQICLTFHYYIIRSTKTGFLKVYLNDTEVWKSPYNENVNNSNKWVKETIIIEYENNPFRIKIIAESEEYSNDTFAIDSIYLKSGFSCQERRPNENSTSQDNYSTLDGFEYSTIVETEVTTIRDTYNDVHNISIRSSGTSTNNLLVWIFPVVLIVLSGILILFKMIFRKRKAQNYSINVSSTPTHNIPKSQYEIKKKSNRQ